MPERRIRSTLPLCLCLLAIVLACCPDGALAARSRALRQSPAPQEEQPPALTAQSFAAHMTLDGPKGSLLVLPLSDKVYSRLQRKDFMDLCVFDASGTPAPFTLREQAPALKEKTLAYGDIRFVSWRPGPQKTDKPLRQTDVEVGSDGSIRIHTGNGRAPEAGSGPEALLLDLQAIQGLGEHPPRNLDGIYTRENLRAVSLEIVPREGASFASHISLQSSEDLTNWRNMGSPLLVARMTQGDTRIERLNIPLPTRPQRFLLLQISGDELPVASFTAHLRYSSEQPPPERESLVSGVLSPDKKTVLYDCGGHFPTRSASFVLPHAEIMDATLHSADSIDGPWRGAGRSTLYRMEKDGAVLESPPLSVSPGQGRSRYWKLVAAGDVPFAFAPDMRLHFTPHELVFLARGEGPWTLAFGRRHGVSVSAFSPEHMGGGQPARIVREPDKPVLPPPLPVVEATPVEEKGLEQWMLWLALGGAVLFLSGIALYLLRSMNKNRTGQDL
ncbi:DUF3999 domain-containing protein [Desulfovibrio sp. OttesenSCG-928-A18]|nr:DUF3999 domain-containing protein [Desulfovibrio sp. OttesenSCG-928-A18]